jgi:5-methylcytosine-specific restriction protein A
MSSIAFTRDEVILALDVLYSAEGQRVSADSEEIVGLSALLNRLPIHPTENRSADFRNARGVTGQLMRFRSSCNTGNRDPSVGILFFNVAFEFEDTIEDLHKIAVAIRRNEPYYSSRFSTQSEDIGFPEGVLLGHLHRMIEVRVTAKFDLANHCEICNLRPELCYIPCKGLLQPHLIVPPVDLNGKKKYGPESFITVCPTCHAVLHRIRPWRTRKDCCTILC